MAEIVEEMGAPLVGCDRGPIEGLDIILHVRYEVVETAHGSFEMKKEVCSFFVGNPIVPVIGCRSHLISHA